MDIKTGVVIVRRSKGGKPRTSRIGATTTTRRALLVYRRTLTNRDGVLFQSRTGTRFTGTGIQLIFSRLSKRTGIHITPHALRRTWALLSLRAGMDALHLQALGGWADLEMVGYYASLEDSDLLKAHRDHSPIDQLR